MTLKWLEGPEAAETLNPIIASRHPEWKLLNPQTCRALVALDEDGVLLRFCALQLYPFIGPEMAMDPARDIESMFAIHQELRKYMDGTSFLVIAEHPVTEKLCEREGFQRVTDPVFRGSRPDRSQVQ